MNFLKNRYYLKTKLIAIALLLFSLGLVAMPVSHDIKTSYALMSWEMLYKGGLQTSDITKLKALTKALADDITLKPALETTLKGNANTVNAWEKLLKQGNSVSDILRKDIKTLEWFAKHGDNIPKSAADDLLASIDKPIKETIEDAQGRLTYVLDRPGQSNKVVSVHTNKSGQFKVTTYDPAYNPALNTSINVPLSENKLTPNYIGTQYMHPAQDNLVVRIELSGNRTTDFERSRAKLRELLSLGPNDIIDETGYTWHHFDDFSYENGKSYSTMQLVERQAHQGTGVLGMQHSGSAAQYRSFHGNGY